jgi:prolipoprotein diacylglyceryltransferase
MGCFLTGLEDETFGLPTNLPWGVNFGDGIARHPTQIYEIIFLLAWAGFLRWCKRFQLESGDLFKLFMIGYLSFRLGIDFLKPHPFNWLVFSGIQIACLLGLIYYCRSILRLLKFFRGKFYDAERLSVLRSNQ